jgi:hypothetical protein
VGVDPVKSEVLRCPSAHVHFNGELERQLKEVEKKRVDRLVEPFITSGPLVGEELRVQLDNYKEKVMHTSTTSSPPYMATYTTGGE